MTYLYYLREVDLLEASAKNLNCRTFWGMQSYSLNLLITVVGLMKMLVGHFFEFLKTKFAPSMTKRIFLTVLRDFELTSCQKKRFCL